MPRRRTLRWNARALLTAVSLLVFLAPLRAQDAAATVVAQMGQVSVLRDGYPQPLFVGSQVGPKQIIVTGPDSYAKLQVSDGSTFEVFQNARVTFRDNYPSWTDLIQVWLGRIRVQIEHRNGPNPNRVSTPTAVISVRGTIFDVVVEDEDDTTLVSVEEGEVMVRHQLLPSERALRAGESMRIFRNQPIARMVDKGGVIRAVLNATRQALLDALYQRPGGGNTPAGGSTTPAGGGGAQGDKGKNGGSSGTGTSTGAPPPPPAAPPPPPGGG